MNYHVAVLTDRLLRTLTQLQQDGVVWMSKDKPFKSESFERKPWKKKPYMLRLLKSEEVNNKFYHGEAWVDKEGKPRPADDAIEETQYKLCWEVIKGDKAGDWIWAFASHWFDERDGKPRGKRAIIARAIDSDFDLAAGIEADNSDLKGGVCMGLVEPSNDPKYGKITSYYPVEDGEEVPGVMTDALKQAAADRDLPLEDGADIPF